MEPATTGISAATIVGNTSGVISPLLIAAAIVAPFAEMAAPDIGSKLIGAGPLGITFGVVYWLLMIYLPTVRAERAEERKSWKEERDGILDRHEQDMDRERKECDSKMQDLEAEIKALNTRIDEYHKHN
jgi:uncharacterized protein YlxW (UPF0749 family)